MLSPFLRDQVWSRGQYFRGLQKARDGDNAIS